jgi:hypothetical protein
LISRHEHEAWDVLLACQGQLRLAPSGHVIGIDMRSALEIAAARGCDVAVLSELLPAAEAGLVGALCSDRVRDGCVIGTHFKVDGDTWNPVDQNRVEPFMDVVTRVRAA